MAEEWRFQLNMTRRGTFTGSRLEGLTDWESILITKNKDCIANFEIPPAEHLTKKFILNPVEGSRSAFTRISEQRQSIMG